MHRLSAKLRNNTAPLKVAVVGVGGTGSEVLSALINVHLGLRALGKPGLEVHAFDPDTVSEANLVRQRYYPQDIGLPKAKVLIHRINLSMGGAMGVKWVGQPFRFDSECARYPWDIVLSCVDSRKERRKLHGYASQKRFTKWALWGDFGNDSDRGQVLFGEPGRSKYALPWATQLHPDLIDLSLPDDDTPSCSTIEAIERQGLLINKTVATLGVQLLWEALKTGKMAHHGYYFNYSRGSFQGVPIPPECVNVKAPQERAAKAGPARAAARRAAPAQRPVPGAARP
ncbi:PRTRC system ThiF family protein [Deinococcus ficus]|uniref:THIF-type NAD/FAD binding fold domain-containing protein n=1 Tax=Deinococcus ficus TaxID=317577 RepID=A0A221T2T7_9DEIO|nr:PRTRC system ThiF family protein [Deinococcus ficus]ASN83237.1 hypothetical protein DFI_18745 [Deinococcus ficus]